MKTDTDKLRTAIRAHCLHECSGMGPGVRPHKEVRDCPRRKCPLYPHRLGRKGRP